MHEVVTNPENKEIKKKVGKKLKQVDMKASSELLKEEEVNNEDE